MIGNLNRAKRQEKIIRSSAQENIITPKELKNILRKNIKLNALPLIATRDKRGYFKISTSFKIPRLS